jgi:hypothetical protein
MAAGQYQALLRTVSGLDAVSVIDVQPVGG